MNPKKFKKLKISLAIFASIIILFGAFGLGFYIRGATYVDEIDTLNYILSMYREHYYYEEEDVITLIENALLDPYSDYLSADENKQNKTDSLGIVKGIIGASIDENCNIVSVVWNSSTDRNGVKVGDQIIAIKTDSSDYVSVSNLAEFKEIFDTVDDDVAFKIKAKRADEILEFTLMREQFTETFVRYYNQAEEYGFLTDNSGMKFKKIGTNNAYDLQGKSSVCVIEYRGFVGLQSGLMGSSAQFKAALEQMKQDGIKNLIIDLRNNGGGYMEVLVDVASHLVCASDNETVPVSVVKYKNGKQEVFKSSKVDYSKYTFESITFLVNAGTASASEALVGAVLDYDSNDIVKVMIEPYYDGYQYVYRSYGKGIMQSTFENYLTGEAIRLTTAQIYWPKSNITIHSVGITTQLNDSLYVNNPKIFNATSNGVVYDAVSLSK